MARLEIKVEAAGGTATAIVVGDVVRLKSGGPKMTVAHLNNNHAQCLYFDEGQFYGEVCINIKALVNT